MQKSRDAPKATPGGISQGYGSDKLVHSSVQTKESLHQQAVGAINEAARINPSSILTLLNTGATFHVRG